MGMQSKSTRRTRCTYSTDPDGKQSVAIRTQAPIDWSVRLDHLAVDLRLAKHELLREALILLLRYHGRSNQLPEPLPPLTKETGKEIDK